MQANQFIKNLIESIPDYKLSSDEEKCIKFEGIEQFIFRKLNSKKFRNSKVPEALEISIKKAINFSVKNNLPIHIVLPFGAYKRWNLPTHPGIDFAEVFNLILMREFLTPIAKAYKYGVILHYYSVELFVERNNRIPQKDIDFYQKDFIFLLEKFKKYLPANMQLKFTNLREEISQEEALKAVEIKVKELKANWPNVEKEVQDIKIKRAKVNCKVDINDPNYNEIILDAVFVHDAFASECWSKNGQIKWINKPDMIVIGHSYTGTWGLHIKSSTSSRVNFWVGIGALKIQDGKYLPTILTYEQFYSLNKEYFTTEKVDFLFKGFSNLSNIICFSGNLN